MPFLYEDKINPFIVTDMVFVIFVSNISSQLFCHVQNQIQELRKDTLKARRGQTLNLGQSNVNAADLAQVSFFAIEFSPYYSVGYHLCNCTVEVSFPDTFTK
jgi:hypothetical protein